MYERPRIQVSRPESTASGVYSVFKNTAAKLPSAITQVPLDTAEGQKKSDRTHGYHKQMQSQMFHVLDAAFGSGSSKKMA